MAPSTRRSIAIDSYASPGCNHISTRLFILGQDPQVRLRRLSFSVGDLHTLSRASLRHWDRLMNLTDTDEDFERESLDSWTEEFEQSRIYSAKLDKLQALCREVGIDPVPRSITQCKKALKNVWVNLSDLMDSRRTGEAVRTFESKQDLRDYSIKNSKVFSLDRAKREGLSALLITMR